ncbi:AraC family transcriptional regulator ligand-binding domain-containing protein [Microbulbifer sp. VVAC002]|uniref:AraC family transcriptional regulator ligand-binding domain-containing protein n=1 Tax=Microbulbifer sp. VVAC002 TaxID=3243387 RepID=UPI00403953BB
MAEYGHTTIATWVLPIIEALKPFCSTQEILQRAEIDPKCIVDANQRIPLENMKKLWGLAESISGDDCIGLQVTKYVNHTNLHALSYAHLASSSIRESLLRSARFSEVVTTAMRINVHDEQQQVVVSWEKVDNFPYDPSIHAIDAFMALLIKSIRKICPDVHHHLISINLERHRPATLERHQLMYKCPINFSADICEIRFKQEFVDRKLSSGNDELVRVNEQALIGYLERLQKNDIVSMTSRVLVDLVSSGNFSQEVVAKELGISCRGLHRKLKERGSSYQTVLDEIRQHQAVQYLKQSDTPITSIAYKLGFCDTSSFSRSFKKWTGKSPREFRGKHSRDTSTEICVD